MAVGAEFLSVPSLGPAPQELAVGPTISGGLTVSE
jgi:hypothetical protein